MKTDEQRIEILSNEAIKLKKELMGVIDKVYEIDEMEGDKLNDYLENEKEMRS